jgi:hypothetical protein
MFAIGADDGRIHKIRIFSEQTCLQCGSEVPSTRLIAGMVRPCEDRPGLAAGYFADFGVCVVIQDPLAAHLANNKYGRFTLTEAIRPALEVPIRPRQGYRVDVFRDRTNAFRLPMLSASVSSELLFDTFLSLVDILGEEVNVVLESSHRHEDEKHQDLRRNHIDRPVLMSHLCEFEDLLLNCGCTGVAVMSTRRPIEVQLDEHKLIYVYAPNLKPFQRVLRELGIKRKKNFALIAEAEHLHHSTDDYADQFEQLCLRVGVGDSHHVFSDEV